jgi:hypothetical protein
MPDSPAKSKVLCCREVDGKKGLVVRNSNQDYLITALCHTGGSGGPLPFPLPLPLPLLSGTLCSRMLRLGVFDLVLLVTSSGSGTGSFSSIIGMISIKRTKY